MVKNKQRRGGGLKYTADKYMPPEFNWERHGEELFARLSEGVPVHELIHELTVDTASRSLTDVRKNLALRLITVCRNCGKLNELIATWRIDEQRVLEGGYWFALAMLEGCHTLLLGKSGERPTWLNSVSRLVSALSAYAAEGYLRTGPQNVRLHGPYASHLRRRCEELEDALTCHQTPGELASDPARALHEVRATKAKTVPGWPNNNSKRDKTAPVICAAVLVCAPTMVNCHGQPLFSTKRARGAC